MLKINNLQIKGIISFDNSELDLTRSDFENKFLDLMGIKVTNNATRFSVTRWQWISQIPRDDANVVSFEGTINHFEGMETIQEIV